MDIHKLRRLWVIFTPDVVKEVIVLINNTNTLLQERLALTSVVQSEVPE